MFIVYNNCYIIFVRNLTKTKKPKNLKKMKTLHTSIISIFVSHGLTFDLAISLADEILDGLDNCSIEQVIYEIADSFMNHTTDANAFIQAKKVVLDIIGDCETPNIDATISRLKNRENSQKIAFVVV